MKVVNEIRPIQINEKDATYKECWTLIVQSHWSYNDRVHLKYGDLDILVLASDLHKAITNATNH